MAEKLANLNELNVDFKYMPIILMAFFLQIKPARGEERREKRRKEGRPRCKGILVIRIQRAEKQREDERERKKRGSHLTKPD